MTDMTLTGKISGLHRYENKIAVFPFTPTRGDQKGSILQFKDPLRLLPSYAVTITYVLTVDEEGSVTECVGGKRDANSVPLTYQKTRMIVRKYSGFGPKRLQEIFKGRGKDAYNNERQLVECIYDKSMRRVLLNLFDRHFQPEEYYFVGCFLKGPQLLEKTAQQLQQLQHLIVEQPTLCCFLSSMADCSAAQGLYDMTAAEVQRCCAIVNRDQEVAASDDFQNSVSVYQRWTQETLQYGATIHKLKDDEDVTYLLSQRLAHQLSDDCYCLLADWEYGEGAIARCVQALLERTTTPATVINDFDYDPSTTPLLLLQHFSLNYYDCLKQLVSMWDDAANTNPDVLVLCENRYHAQLIQRHSRLTAAVYYKDDSSPPVIKDTVGLLIIDHSHLWDSIRMGRLLRSLQARWHSMHLICCGESRGMPAHGRAAVFSDLYSSKCAPVVYADEPPIAPLSISSGLLSVLQRGSNYGEWKHVFHDLHMMSMTTFLSESNMRNIKQYMSERRSVRVLCRKQKVKQSLYEQLRESVWNHSGDWRSDLFFHREAVYSSKLRQSLHAEHLEIIIRKRNRNGVYIKMYNSKSVNFPCELSGSNYTNSLILMDYSTGESFKLPLCYSEGIYPATVDLYSRIHSFTHTDRLYVVIDRKTSWRLLYSAITMPAERLTLIYPDSCSDDDSVRDLLNHILHNNWKQHYRTGVLKQLLSDH